MLRNLILLQYLDLIIEYALSLGHERLRDQLEGRITLHFSRITNSKIRIITIISTDLKGNICENTENYVSKFSICQSSKEHLSL